MADTDKKIGKDMAIYVNGTKIAESTNIGVSLELNVDNVTSSDSGKSEENLPTYYSGSISFDFLEAPESSNYNIYDIQNLLINGTKVNFIVSEKGQSGSDPWVSGSGYITSASLDLPFDAAISGNGTITTSGAVTVAENT